MPFIHLTTFIKAPQQRLFDLSRSISLLKLSMEQYDARAVAGVTSGLLEPGETVTWQGRYFFKTRVFTTKISAMQQYDFFEEEMTEGAFKMLRHRHFFKAADNGTFLIDTLEFETPYAMLGKWINRLFLTDYVKKLLEKRNAFLLEYAETEKWQTILY